MNEETIRVLHQGDPNDTRFQFEIIKELAASVRTMGETQTEMLVRLARIEEHRVHEAVATVAQRVTVLENDHNQRKGAAGAFDLLLKWGPLIFSALCAIYLYGRASGLIAPAPQSPAHIPQEHSAVVPSAPRTQEAKR